MMLLTMALVMAAMLASSAPAALGPGGEQPECLLEPDKPVTPRPHGGSLPEEACQAIEESPVIEPTLN